MFLPIEASEFVSSARGAQLITSVPNMKNRKAKTASEPHPDDMLSEYDFSKSRPNPYAAAFEAGTVAVVLDADVAKRFPDAKAVNAALRGLK
ncbi:MAG: hypothetical protein WD801_12190 [Gemmatimonadaceae bacterium]